MCWRFCDLGSCGVSELGGCGSWRHAIVSVSPWLFLMTLEWGCCGVVVCSYPRLKGVVGWYKEHGTSLLRKYLDESSLRF